MAHPLRRSVVTAAAVVAVMSAAYWMLMPQEDPRFVGCWAREMPGGLSCTITFFADGSAETAVSGKPTLWHRWRVEGDALVLRHFTLPGTSLLPQSAIAVTQKLTGTIIAGATDRYEILKIDKTTLKFRGPPRRMPDGDVRLASTLTYVRGR